MYQFFEQEFVAPPHSVERMSFLIPWQSVAVVQFEIYVMQIITYGVIMPGLRFANTKFRPV